MRKELAISFLEHDNHFWMQFPLNTTILNENDPVWFERGEAYEIKGSFEDNLIVGEGVLHKKIISWTGTKREYQVVASRSAAIIESTMYFPGWETRVNGEKIDLRSQAGRHFGLINFDVLPGENHIITQFTQNTPARIIGNTLTIFGTGLLILKARKDKHAA